MTIAHVLANLGRLEIFSVAIRAACEIDEVSEGNMAVGAQGSLLRCRAVPPRTLRSRGSVMNTRPLPKKDGLGGEVDVERLCYDNHVPSTVMNQYACQGILVIGERLYTHLIQLSDRTLLQVFPHLGGRQKLHRYWQVSWELQVECCAQHPVAA